jgi:hypothetical protein
MTRNPNKKPKPKIHIFHNGEVAESDYFGDFAKFLSDNDAWVIVNNYHKRTKGKAPWQLINEAVRQKISKKDGDQVWCFFDIDDYLKDAREKFENGLKKAKQQGIKLAWSNQCFELWLMLHFNQVSTAVSRQDYEKKLQNSLKKIGVDYEKNSLQLFHKLLPLQPEAMQRAKKIFQKDQPQENPSTSLFLLIEELNNFLNQ